MAASDFLEFTDRDNRKAYVLKSAVIAIYEQSVQTVLLLGYPGKSDTAVLYSSEKVEALYKRLIA